MIYILESPTHKVFIGLLFVYKVLLQLLALFLAFCTHKVKVKGLDDTKCIITSIYVTTINVALVTMTFYFLKEYLSVYASIFTLLIFVSTTLILGLIFIPKVAKQIIYSIHHYVNETSPACMQ